MRGPGVMIRATSVSAASSTLSMSTRSDAWMTPVSSLSAINVRSSSAFRMFSRPTCSPTTKVVTRSATIRTTLRRGVTMKIHLGRKRADSSVANLTGKLTAMVFGVTSPNSSSNGTITTTLIQPASSSPKARDQDHCHVGRRGDVNQFVAAEQRDDQTPRLVEHGVDALGMGIARIAQFLQVDAAEREKRRFGTREKSRHAEQATLDQQTDQQLPVDRRQTEEVAGHLHPIHEIPPPQQMFTGQHAVPRTSNRSARRCLRSNPLPGRSPARPERISFMLRRNKHKRHRQRWCYGPQPGDHQRSAGMPTASLSGTRDHLGDGRVTVAAGQSNVCSRDLLYSSPARNHRRSDPC
jgi:hypothetical protein